MSILEYYYFYFSAVFSEYPPVIQFAVFIVMVLLILSIASLIRFFTIRSKQRRQDRREQKIRKWYRDVFAEVLYFTLQTVTIKELREGFEIKKPNRNWQKTKATDLILKLKDERSFELEGGIFNDKNYQILLEYLNIFKYWEKEMSSDNPVKILRALRVVNNLGTGVSGSVISRSVYHRKDYLRKFARTTFTRFDTHDPYRFLEEGFDKHFNQLDEIRLHYILIQMSKEQPLPHLTKWIKNVKKESYKSFLIKEIGYFEQIEAAPYLIELYENSESLKVKCQIVRTLGLLHYNGALDLFESEFKFAQQSLQLCIIKGVENLNTNEALSFLSHAYQDTQFSECKVRIVNLIKKFKGHGDLVLMSLSEKSHTDFERKLFDFALN